MQSTSENDVLGSRTRFRERYNVEQAVPEVLPEAEASSWLLVEIEE
jgi:hypothetical protein